MQAGAIEVDTKQPLPESSWQYWTIEGGEDDLRAVHGGGHDRDTELARRRDAERFQLSGTDQLPPAGTVSIDDPQAARHGDTGIRVANASVATDDEEDLAAIT